MTNLITLFWFFSGVASLVYNFQTIITIVGELETAYSVLKVVAGVVIGLFHVLSGPAALLGDLYQFMLLRVKA